MEPYLREMLICPACHGELEWRTEVTQDGHIERGEARCTACGADYPVREGIGVFLTPDLPRNDLWEEVESALARYLRDHPEVEQQLLDAPEGALAPADLFYRALALEERGRFQEAKEAVARALPGLYTSDYLACYRSQLDYVLQELRSGSGCVVDLASGRGDLVERILAEVGRPVVATDFSLRVLRRNRRRFEALGMYRGISLLCCDARRTPFRTGALATVTSNLGLANIEHPAGLLAEIQRVLCGEFLAVSVFYPEDDSVHVPLLEQYGLAS
ncbi:MAG: methyltransferase domain-containing protein, partial [Chloroflexia bacterium]